MSAMLPRLFDDSVFDVFDPFADFGRGHNRVFGKHASHLMKTDIRETDTSYKFSIDLPGFKKEDVSAELKDGYLTVTAVKNHQDEEKNEQGTLIRQERYSGSCSRTFYVGENVDEKDCGQTRTNTRSQTPWPSRSPRAWNLVQGRSHSGLAITGEKPSGWRFFKSGSAESTSSICSA